MAQSKHPVLRVIVPLVVIVAAIAIGYGTLVAGRSSKPAEPSAPSAGTATPPATGAAQAKPAEAPATPTTPPPTPAAAAQPATPPPSTTPAAAPAAAVTLTGLRAKPQADGTLELAPIGGLDAKAKGDGAPLLQVEFDPAGVGIKQLSLARQFVSVQPNAAHEVLQRAESHRVVSADGQLVSEKRVVPMAIIGVGINGQFVSLADLSGGPVWKQTAPGKFAAEIIDGSGAPVAAVERSYEISPGTYDLVVRQGVRNLTGSPLTVQWYQLGPADIPDATISYGGDMRRVRIGYVPGPTSNPNGQVVLADRFLMPHAEAVGKLVLLPGASTTTFADVAIWPPKENPDASQLAYAGLASRYFSAVVHTLPDAQAKRPDGLPDKVLRSVATIDRVLLDREPNLPDAERIRAVTMVLRITGAAVTVAPGAVHDTSMGLYVGPTEERSLRADARLREMGLDHLVLFTMGGPCAFCTFQPVAHLLHGVLVFLHDNIFRDWALAVIFLVVCVRTVLHPVTRWSQANLTRFGKQMAKIGPKQAKLKEKFGHDPKLMQAEMAKLMREENVNYAGMLGCVPAILQTPIWIALYAMISFSFELRHQPAFYGVFQALTGGAWGFLADMSVPDRAIPFGTSVNLWIGHVDSFNVLPILLGIVFYIQQKYLTPPTSTELTPEQETTQKITKIMMVVMFPVFMYNSPAALTLYFLTNSTLGILESKWIRAHVDRQDAEAEKLRAANNGRRPEGKKPGFFQRLQERVAEVQAQREQMARDASKRKR